MNENIYQNPQKQNYYCYWDVRSNIDFFISIGNLVIALLLIILVAFAYRRAKKLFKADSLFNIYYFLFAWYICYTIQYIYGTVIYKQEFENKSNNDIGPTTIATFSIIFQFMDFFPAFLLITCLNYVSYHLLKRIHNICDRKGLAITKIQYYFYEALKKYQWFRILYILPTVALLFCINTDPKVISKFSLAELILYLFDSFMCNIILLVGVRTLRKKKAFLNLSNENQQKKLKRQSIILQLTGICRLGMGLGFILISNLVTSGDDSSCPKGPAYRTWFYMLIGQIVMHFMPVLVVLSIFRISNQEIREMRVSRESFLSTEETGNNLTDEDN